MRATATTPSTDIEIEAAAALAAAVTAAAFEYIARRDRARHPAGRTDNASRWYPADDERCSCCDSIREPSRAYPWSLAHHCRTIPHIAELFGVDATAIRRAVKAIEATRDATDGRR
jgi:hypothetical protein